MVANFVQLALNTISLPQTFSYRLLLADSVRGKAEAMAGAGLAVMDAVPSCSIPMDMRSARLHVLPPGGQGILNVTVEPQERMRVGPWVKVGTRGYFVVPVAGVSRGRARVTVEYSGGSRHVANYHVLPALDAHVRQYEKFLATTMWYSNLSDPFGAVITGNGAVSCGYSGNDNAVF